MAFSSPSLSPFSSSSLFDDDSDWDLTVVGDGGDADSVSDADWVITGDEGYYVPSRSMAGVFVPFNNHPAFISLQPNSSSLCDPSVPPSSSVLSSSRGLVLSRRPWSSYFVSNPSTGAQASLPKPPGPHPAGSPLAVVSRAPAYHVVCAVAGAHKGSYRFSTFSSSRGAWRSSEVEHELARIVPNTGVSCGSSAYWRTESRMVVEYDVVADQARTLMPPPVSLSDARDRWQLGRAGEKLCCALATGSNLEVYALGVKDQWALVCSIGIVVGDKEWDGGEPIVCRKSPQPLRFESDELEVLLMVDGKLVVLWLENRKMRVVQLEKPAPDLSDEYVPFIDDPLASVDFSVDTLSAEWYK